MNVELKEYCLGMIKTSGMQVAIPTCYLYYNQNAHKEMNFKILLFANNEIDYSLTISAVYST